MRRPRALAPLASEFRPSSVLLIKGTMNSTIVMIMYTLQLIHNCVSGLSQQIMRLPAGCGTFIFCRNHTFQFTWFMYVLVRLYPEVILHIPTKQTCSYNFMFMCHPNDKSNTTRCILMYVQPGNATAAFNKFIVCKLHVWVPSKNVHQSTQPCIFYLL